MRRIQIHGGENDISVYLKFPNADPNKKYKLGVEKFIIPAIHSLTLDKALFTVERRLRIGVGHTAIRYTLPVKEQYYTFTPKHIHTTCDFLDQLNTFIRELLYRLKSADIGYNALIHASDVGAALDHEDTDWNLFDENQKKAMDAQIAFYIRTDGKLGLRLSINASRVFVFKFTEEGKRIFEFDNDYFVYGAGHILSSVYLDGAEDVAVDIEANIAGLNTLSHIFDVNIYNHLHYRTEIAILMSIPLDNKVQISDTTHQYLHELASYRLPTTHPTYKYDYEDVYFLTEDHVNIYEFESSLSTFNKYKLTSTDLQNFNIKIVTRSFYYEDGKYVQRELPFEFSDKSFFFLQLSVLPSS